jgi:hypothetical protein
MPKVEECKLSNEIHFRKVEKLKTRRSEVDADEGKFNKGDFNSRKFDVYRWVNYLLGRSARLGWLCKVGTLSLIKGNFVWLLSICKDTVFELSTKHLLEEN